MLAFEAVGPEKPTDAKGEEVPYSDQESEMNMVCKRKVTSNEKMFGDQFVLVMLGGSDEGQLMSKAVVALQVERKLQDGMVVVKNRDRPHLRP